MWRALSAATRPGNLLLAVLAVAGCVGGVAVVALMGSPDVDPASRAFGSVHTGARALTIGPSAVCRKGLGRCDAGRRYPRTSVRGLGEAATRGFTIRFNRGYGGVFLSLHRLKNGHLGRVGRWVDGGQVIDTGPIRDWRFDPPVGERFSRADTLLVRVSRSPGGPVRGVELEIR